MLIIRVAICSMLFHHLATYIGYHCSILDITEMPLAIKCSCNKLKGMFSYILVHGYELKLAVKV